ncbi:hypothetical protein Vafri_14787 [Volvox africanus]|uniref:Uncharacterized protein n=1 Tax=Volvox africanus TaxID=51714 RepID=A0A8J4F402_9CHLO|nr:hypothetical protein Vafri_14787 [Volvox africanus]
MSHDPRREGSCTSAPRSGTGSADGSGTSVSSGCCCWWRRHLGGPDRPWSSSDGKPHAGASPPAPAAPDGANPVPGITEPLPPPPPPPPAAAAAAAIATTPAPPADVAASAPASGPGRNPNPNPSPAPAPSPVPIACPGPIRPKWGSVGNTTLPQRLAYSADQSDSAEAACRDMRYRVRTSDMALLAIAAAHRER